MRNIRCNEIHIPMHPFGYNTLIESECVFYKFYMACFDDKIESYSNQIIISVNVKKKITINFSQRYQILKNSFA